MERGTVEIYEAKAAEWKARRPARFAERAVSLRDAVPSDEVRIDVGCGAGMHLDMLGRPVVALDAAFAMLRLAHEAAPDAWCVQADVEAMPFRSGALGGAWARATYLHVRRNRLPLALMQLHRSLRVGAPVALTMRHGEAEGTLPDDDFPGRFFAEWRAGPLADVVTGAGFAVTECAVEAEGRDWVNVRGTRARTLPDVVSPGMRLLVCGLNPSLYSADRGIGFARPANRFWPAALAAGIVTHDRDPLHALRVDRVGMTDLVKRATRGAGELTGPEYQEGVARVERLVRWLRPGAVCFVGLAGWRAALDRKATAGEQPGGFGGVPAYLMPNTSGINGRTSLEQLAEHLRAAAGLADRAPRAD